MAKKSKDLIMVDLPRMHPQQEVAEHEVLLAFNGDSDAELFIEWWHTQGLSLFSRWAVARKEERKKT